jgi:hypothetical protein
MDLWATRDGNYLRPLDAESAAVLSKLRIGKPLKIDVRQPRNSKHHRLYWVLCTRIANSVGAEPENISDVLKIETGHCVTVKTAKDTYRLPRSISFAAMDQSAFGQFFERCIQIIQTQWGIRKPDLMRELADILEPQTELRA